MLYRESPTSSVSEIFEPIPSNFPYSVDSDHGFFFMLGIQNNDEGQFLDQPIYNVSFINSEKGEKLIPMDPCTLDNLSSI